MICYRFSTRKASMRLKIAGALLYQLPGCRITGFFGSLLAAGRSTVEIIA